MRTRISPHRAIAEIAAAQGGIIDHEQLLAIGVSSAAITRWIEAGLLHPQHVGVYAVGHPRLSALGRRWAAVRACGPGAVLSHASAGDAWRMRRSAAALIDVTVPNRSARCRPGIRIHRPRTLPPDEVTALDGLPITTPARTLLDLAATGLRGRRLEAALDHAERALRIDWADVALVIEAHPRRRGTPALRAVLAAYAPGTVETLSALEEIVLELCDRAGIPRPLVNAVVEGRRRDFVWPQQRLVVEADSYTWHRSPSALNDDRERDVELTLAGWTVLRFTYAQCTKRRAYVTRSIHRALGLNRAR
jgi:uncharacterized protein DUF559/putative AbiEi antitoxin of type IV toxin-antitoxin system